MEQMFMEMLLTVIT